MSERPFRETVSKRSKDKKMAVDDRGYQRGINPTDKDHFSTLTSYFIRLEMPTYIIRSRICCTLL